MAQHENDHPGFGIAVEGPCGSAGWTAVLALPGIGVAATGTGAALGLVTIVGPGGVVPAIAVASAGRGPRDATLATSHAPT